jgi:hypothetical protein
VTDRIDASVDPVEVARPDPADHGALGDAGRNQLGK